MDEFFLSKIKATARDPDRRYWDGCVRRVVSKEKTMGISVELLECGHKVSPFTGTYHGSNFNHYRVCPDCEDLVEAEKLLCQI